MELEWKYFQCGVEISIIYNYSGWASIASCTYSNVAPIGRLKTMIRRKS